LCSYTSNGLQGGIYSMIAIQSLISSLALKLLQLVMPIMGSNLWYTCSVFDDDRSYHVGTGALWLCSAMIGTIASHCVDSPICTLRWACVWNERILVPYALTLKSVLRIKGGLLPKPGCSSLWAFIAHASNKILKM
jgi:hypothetical protein